MGAKKTPATPPTVTEPLQEVAITIPRRWPWWIGLIASLAVLSGSAILAYTSAFSIEEHRIFNAVNGVDLPEWVIAQIARPVSDAVWGMCILVVLMLLLPRFRRRAWRYVAAAGSTYAVVTALEQLVHRARPPALYSDVLQRATQDGLGFPSTHVALMTALGLAVWPYVAWPWRVFIVVLIGAVAWSRLFLGVHAPLDIVGGFAAGVTVVAGIRLLPRKVRVLFRLGL